jgi:hypothetical protein
MSDPETPQIPVGDDYFRVVARLEAQCEAATDAYLPRAGNKAPQTWARLGACLALLDGVSSCGWGCHGGDHAVEYLVGRVVGSVRASLRLMRAGLYDEALNALRTGGEIVNLMTLMQTDVDLLAQWRSASAPERYYMARPSEVIKKLAAQGRGDSSLNAEKYDLLSRIAHGNTTKAPQSYNPMGLPITAGVFQGKAGVFVVLNEAALVTVLASVPPSRLCPMANVRAGWYSTRLRL